MPEQAQGFDREMFLSLANQRSSAFAEAKKSNQNWMPPPSLDGQDYLCELVDVHLGTFKDRRTDEIVPYFRPLFRIADEEHTDSQNKPLTNRRFGQLFSTQENRLGIVSRVIAGLYGEDSCPDALGEALVGLPAQKGKFYGIAIREPRDPQYPPNLYINKCFGRGEEVAAPDVAPEGEGAVDPGETTAAPAEVNTPAGV